MSEEQDIQRWIACKHSAMTYTDGLGGGWCGECGLRRTSNEGFDRALIRIVLAQVEALRAENARLKGAGVQLEAAKFLNRIERAQRDSHAAKLRAVRAKCRSEQARADHAEALNKHIQDCAVCGSRWYDDGFTASCPKCETRRAEAERDAALIERDAMRMAHQPLQASLTYADIAIPEAEERGFRAGFNATDQYPHSTWHFDPPDGGVDPECDDAYAAYRQQQAEKETP